MHHTNIRRFINEGQKVPKDAVRVEEMINFFKYKYPEPEGQNPFSINTEVCDSPWNKNSLLLKIGLQGKNVPMTNLPASNLVFLIEVSGSMDESNYNDELATIKFRYKKPDGDKSIEIINTIPNKKIAIENSSSDFKFTTTVAWFGLKLRESKFISNSASADIKKLAKSGLSNDEEGYRAEFI